MINSLSNLFDHSPLDGVLTSNESVLDEINRDIFHDIDLHAPPLRVYVAVNNNSDNTQLKALSSMLVIISYTNTVIPMASLYENIKVDALGYNNGKVLITNPDITAAFNNAPIGYKFNLSIKYTYLGYNSISESTVNYGDYIPRP